MSAEIKRRLAKYVRPRDQWTPIDEAIYSVDNLYCVETAKAEQLRLEALKYSFSHHYENNGFYRRLCQQEGVAPADIKESQDLMKIPLIPDTFFKDYPYGSEFYRWLQQISSVKFPDIQFKSDHPSFDDVIEACAKSNILVTFTSGSSGRFSFFPRDDLTWLRQSYCGAAPFAEMLSSEYEAGNPDMVYIGFHYNPYQTHWLGNKASSFLIEALFDKQNVKFFMDKKVTTETIRIIRGNARGIKEKVQAMIFNSGRKKDIARLWDVIQSSAKQGRKIFFNSMPFTTEVMLLSPMEARGEKLSLGENGWLITAGGWKLPSNRSAITGEKWRQRVKDILGIPEEHCRDMYALSECNAPFPECEGHYKHIPNSILYPFILDEELKPIKNGNEGRLALLDPTPNSYPGFIITGDKVKILNSCPACGRSSPVFDHHVSRIGGVESRGCGGVAAELLQEIQKKNK